MITIVIRDKQEDSQYIVLVRSGATAHSAYRTISEFVNEWWDTLNAIDFKLPLFSNSQPIVMMADWNIKDCYEVVILPVVFCLTVFQCEGNILCHPV